MSEDQPTGRAGHIRASMAMTALKPDLLPLLACPSCHGALESSDSTLRCVGCGLDFSIRDGVPILLSPESRAHVSASRSQAENVVLRSRLAKMPLLMRLIGILRAPHPFWYMRRRVSHRQRQAFAALAARDGTREAAVFLDIGSGILGGRNCSGLSRYVRENTVSLEIAPTKGIGVVGDAHQIPFQGESVDGVLIQGVLEHVADPEKVVAEIMRVLRPGAPVFAEVPFIQHYHLDPLDFQRWTHYGFQQLFHELQIESAGVCAGPASALADMLTEFFAVPFSNPTLYWGTKSLLGWIFAPIQFLDVFWSRAARAHIMAGAVYVLGYKPRINPQGSL